MYDAPCKVTDDGYCERHKTRHVGRLLELALMDNEQGAGYRRLWDKMNKTATPEKKGGCGCKK
jgi:hypothetical protein